MSIKNRVTRLEQQSSNQAWLIVFVEIGESTDEALMRHTHGEGALGRDVVFVSWES